MERQHLHRKSGLVVGLIEVHVHKLGLRTVCLCCEELRGVVHVVGGAQAAVEALEHLPPERVPGVGVHFRGDVVANGSPGVGTSYRRWWCGWAVHMTT